MSLWNSGAGAALIGVIEAKAEDTRCAMPYLIIVASYRFAKSRQLRKVNAAGCEGPSCFPLALQESASQGEEHE